MKISAIATIVLAAMLLAGCDQMSQPSSSARQDTYALIYTVDSATLERPSGGAGALVVKASGTVRSSGWSHPELRQDISASANDMLTYRFVAIPPPKDTNVAQAALPVDAMVRIESVPAAVRTIRVIAETNRTDTALVMETAPDAPPAEQPPANQAAPQ